MIAGSRFTPGGIELPVVAPGLFELDARIIEQCMAWVNPGAGEGLPDYARLSFAPGLICSGFALRCRVRLHLGLSSSPLIDYPRQPGQACTMSLADIGGIFVGSLRHCIRKADDSVPVLLVWLRRCVERLITHDPNPVSRCSICPSHHGIIVVYPRHDPHVSSRPIRCARLVGAGAGASSAAILARR